MASTDLTSQIQTVFPNAGPPLISIPLNTRQIHLLLDNKLLPLLPYPVTVIRRIQFELNNPSPTAQVHLTAPIDISPSTDRATISDTVTDFLSEPSSSPPPATHPYLVTYVDLTPAGQTQAWTFSTSEIPTTHSPPFEDYPPSPPADPVTAPPPKPSTAPLPLIRLLFAHILTNLIPQRPTTPPADWLWLRDNEKYLSQPYSTHKVLFGTVHSSLIPFFSLPGQTRLDGRYQKLLVPPTAANANDASTVPQGYTLTSPLHDADLHTVLNRSPIPRTIGTLRALPSVGLYMATPPGSNGADVGPGECVGWGFLSKDGSISSLHVEPAHRGKGLATCMVRALLGRQAVTFSTSENTSPQVSNGTTAAEGTGQGQQEQLGEEREKAVQQWWGIADVEAGNGPSQRVMAKLGARPWWGVQWVEIDVPVVLKGLEGWEERQSTEGTEWIDKGAEAKGKMEGRMGKPEGKGV